MCLQTVDRRLRDNSTMFGWKVFRIRRSVGITSIFQKADVAYKINEWNKSYHESIQAGDSHIYMSGFHAFLTREAARKWCCDSNTKYMVLKVKLRGPKTFGLHYGDAFSSSSKLVPSVVADEMLIVPGQFKRKGRVR